MYLDFVKQFLAERKMNRLLIVLLIMFTAVGCDDTSLDPLSNSGDIVGYVTVKGEECDNAPNASGVEVSLVGTDIKATTNAEGRWEMSDVPSGTYDIEYKRSDLASRLDYAFQFVGNGRAILPTVGLQPIPDQRVLDIQSVSLTWYATFNVTRTDTIITEDLVTVNESGELVTLHSGTAIDSGTMIGIPITLKSVKLHIALDDPSRLFRYVVALSDKPGATPKDTRTLTGLVDLQSVQNSNVIELGAEWLESWSKLSNGNVYFTIWGASCNVRRVQDPESGLTRYVGISESGSNEVSVNLDL